EAVDPIRGTDTENETALLFTTKTCPNCSMVEKLMDRTGFQYKVIDAEEHEDLVKQYGIRQAPTLVMVSSDHADTYPNASNIIRYLNTRA
ncbi:MAG: thioredoxin family protein, partial [Solobacterium sp.]|nr:thioredoxin family protein [Solobacterium sp.]